jgi:hypothetical protein
VEVKCLFSTVPEAKKRRRKEVTGVTGRWIGRSWRVRLVQPAGAWGEVLGFVTRASVAPRDRCVRSRTQGSSVKGRVDRMPGRVRSHATGHVRSTKSLSGPFLYSNRTPRVTRPVNSSVMSGHAMNEKVTFRDRWRSNERNLKRDTWRASAKLCRYDRTLWPCPVDQTCASGQRA